jgi:hypothetical protein
MIANERNKQKIINELDRLQNLPELLGVPDKLSLKKLREKYIYKDINDSEIVRDIHFIKNIRNQSR